MVIMGTSSQNQVAADRECSMGILRELRVGIQPSSSRVISEALPPAAVVLTLRVRSAAKRYR